MTSVTSDEPPAHSISRQSKNQWIEIHHRTKFLRFSNLSQSRNAGPCVGQVRKLLIDQHPVSMVTKNTRQGICYFHVSLWKQWFGSEAKGEMADSARMTGSGTPEHEH